MVRIRPLQERRLGTRWVRVPSRMLPYSLQLPVTPGLDGKPILCNRRMNGHLSAYYFCPTCPAARVSAPASASVARRNQVESSSVRRLSHGAVAVATGLYPLAVDARGGLCGEAAFSGLLGAVIVHVLDIEGMDVAGQEPKGWRVSGLRPRQGEG